MEEYILKREEFIARVTNPKYRDLKFSQIEEQANILFRQILCEERNAKDDKFYQGYTLKYQLELLRESKIYQAIKALPKGAVLHVHNDCCMDVDWLNKFKSFNSPKEAEQGYKNLYFERELVDNKDQFDDKIRRLLYITEEDRLQSDENIWKIFERKIIGLDSFTYRRDIFKIYLKQYLKNFIDDGVFHIEIRTELGVKKNEDGSLVSLEEEVEIINQVIDELKSLNPHFSLKIIIECLKCLDLADIEQSLRFAFQAKKQYPDLICGFDMIQEEDSNKSILEMCEIFAKIKDFEKEYGVQLPLLFHGGESLQTITNTNLFDAILLNCQRIGHGINLAQHSYLFDIIKNKDICLEICPVSNQILKYIDDIRLHPIKTFLNYGINLCINPDDPGLFNYKGVTMDYFYASFGTELDYKDLKLCIYNSIKYSFLEEKKKSELIDIIEANLQSWACEFIKQNTNLTEQKQQQNKKR